jgi:hypothetical protein
MRRRAGALLGAAVLVLAGCASGGEAQSPVASARAPAATALPTPIDKPAGKPVLKLSGSVSNRNQGAALVLDQQQLDAMATETVTLYEPFLKKPIEFTGIPMSVLLTRAGMSASATKIRVHALDDYAVGFKVADLMAPGVLLATRQSGAPIPLAQGGPIRLVFPPDSVTGRNRDTWVWSIDTITVS